MAIEKIIGTRGLESNRQSFASNRAVNDAGGAQILGEEIVPVLHFLRVHQKQRAGNVARAGEVFSRAFCPRRSRAHAAGATVPEPRQSTRRAPGTRYRDGTQSWICAVSQHCDDGHLGGTFRPGSREREVLGVDAVRPSGLEGVYAPVHGPLHGRRARNPTTNLIRQAMQIGFKR